MEIVYVQVYSCFDYAISYYLAVRHVYVYFFSLRINAYIYIYNITNLSIIKEKWIFLFKSNNFYDLM